VFEVSQTFDGNSNPVKKTTTNRWEEYAAEEYRINESKESVYYLRSTALGGQVVAELDETGYKRRGYVFAGGMRLATQYVWNPGYGYDVAWVSTSPATGSEYMPNSYFLGRAELDPLGNDVTYSPQPQVVPEPVFYNPKFDQMPLEIEGGPSDAYHLANAQWAELMATTFQDIYDAGRADKLWQAGKRSEAMAILMRNPNVGVEYRVILEDEVTRRGSHFGKDAADFLNGIDIAVSAGLLMPVTYGTATLQDSSIPSERRLKPDEYAAIRTEMGRALVAKECRQFINKLVTYVRGAPFDSSKDFLKFSDDIYKSSDGNVSINAAVLMHELIHGLQGPGSDDTLSRAIRDLGIIPVRKDGTPLPFPTGKRNGKPYNDWSEYWDRALKNACFPTLQV
jgi:hypothetical protein